MERVSQKKIFSGILVALLLLLRFTPSAYAADASERYEEIIDRVASEYVGSTVPGALVMISEHGETVFSKGYGFADLNNRVPMDAESTVFEWGSISKTFVWVSVMQLVEAGKIDLQTDIRAYLPDGFLKNLQYDETVTMLHLMNHTAGFEEELLDLRYTGEDEERPLREVLSSHQPKQAYRPGSVNYLRYGQRPTVCGCNQGENWLRCRYERLRETAGSVASAASADVRHKDPTGTADGRFGCE